MVIFIHRNTEQSEQEKEQGKKDGSYEAEFIMAKFRSGEPGSFFLGWDGSRTTFVNLERDANEQSLINAYAQEYEAPRGGEENLVPPPEEVAGSVEDFGDIWDE